MKKILTATIALLCTAAATAQNENQTTNRYGQPIELKDGRWVATGDKATIFTSMPDTIPEYGVPYNYVREKLSDDDFTGFTTKEYTYKTYPSGRKMKLAIDIPSRTEGPYPLIVMYHGGGWRIGSYAGGSVQEPSAFVASQGVASVRVGYTLLNNGTIEDCIDDVNEAMKFIVAHAAEWNVDPERIGFMGFSAGGHLSSYMAMTWPGTKVLVSQSGPHDLAAFFEPTGGLKSRPLGGYFGVATDDMTPVNKYSPLFLIPEGDKIPAVLLTHGTYDALVSYAQSVNFAEALLKKGARTVEIFPIAYGPHNCHTSANATYENEMLRIIAFIKAHL